MLEALQIPPKANSTLIYSKLDAQGLGSHLGLGYESHELHVCCKRVGNWGWGLHHRGSLCGYWR